MKTNRVDTRAMCKTALCAALLCVSSYISIPLPFTTVPITGQTIAVNLVALLLTPVQAAIALGVYILLGAVGLPVFAGGSGGIGCLVSPASGYIYGFLIAAVLIALLKGKRPNLIRYLIVTICVGIPVVDLCGMVSLMLVSKLTLGGAFMGGAVPFLATDIVKCVAASLIAVALEKALRKIPAAA